MPKLIIESGPAKGRELRIEPQTIVRFGADRKADVQVPDALLSRMHFDVEAVEDTYVLHDRGTNDGTFVNGRRVREHALKVGDTIRAGDLLVSVVEDDEGRLAGGLIGRSIAGFRIDERVGRGGMGTVYRARQLSLDRPVAVKVLSDELTHDADFVESFFSEAKATAQIEHPNVVEVHDVGQAERLYYICMEYVPGGSVKDLLAREGRLAPERAMEIALDAARGLEFAERKGIVHRDIKPDNLMIGEDGRVKIADLGLAVRVRGGEGGAARDRGFCGSPHYVAPEQARGEVVDHRADIYALGATLYHMLSGCKPFEGSTVSEVLEKQVREPPVPLRRLARKMPPGLDRVVERMMAKAPADRYPKASEVADDLKRILWHLAPPARGARRRPAAGRGRRLRIALALSALLAAALAAALGVATLLGARREAARLQDATLDFSLGMEQERGKRYDHALDSYQRARAKTSPGKFAGELDQKIAEMRRKLEARRKGEPR